MFTPKIWTPNPACSCMQVYLETAYTSDGQRLRAQLRPVSFHEPMPPPFWAFLVDAHILSVCSAKVLRDITLAHSAAAPPHGDIQPSRALVYPDSAAALSFILPGRANVQVGG